MASARNRLIVAVAAGLLAVLGCVPAPDGPRPAKLDNPNYGVAELLGVAPAPRTDPLRTRIETAVRHVAKRPVHTDDPFWVVFHAVLGFGPDLELVDRKTGTRVNAVKYIFGGGPMPGLEFTATDAGIDVSVDREGKGIRQGHQDQFVAEMGQWGTPATEPVTVGGKKYTFDDFVRFSQFRARTDAKADQELSWAVPLLAQYRGTSLEWTNGSNEKLRFEDLVRYELNVEVERSACGGTHRLFGLTWAYHLHLTAGGKDEGVWREVAAKNLRYRDNARKHQLADGSFSANYFLNTPLAAKRPRVPGADAAFGVSPRPGHSRERFQRINATGHVVEWMALALSDDDLREPWMTDAVDALCLMLLDLEEQAYDAAIYHAVHGLYLYYARVYGYGSFVPQRLMIPLPPSWKQPDRTPPAGT